MIRRVFFFHKKCIAVVVHIEYLGTYLFKHFYLIASLLINCLGKVASIKVLMRKMYLSSSINKFYDRISDIIDVVRAREVVVVAMCDEEEGKDLNDYRYKCFAKSMKRNASMLVSIPPTKAFMEQHSKRVFLEMNNTSTTSLIPTNFGWRNAPNELMRTTTTQDPAPCDILRIIFCSCAKGCGKSCGCRKSGLKCNITLQELH